MKEKAIEIIERYFSIVISAIISIIVYRNMDTLVTVEKFDIIMTSIITIVVTLIGALITALTILIAIINSQIVRAMHESKLWNKMINNIVYPIIIGFAVLGYSIYMIAIETDNLVNKIDITIILFAGLMFTLGLIKIGILIVKIIKLLPDTSSDKSHEEFGATLDENEVILHYNNKNNKN